MGCGSRKFLRVLVFEAVNGLRMAAADQLFGRVACCEVVVPVAGVHAAAVRACENAGDERHFSIAFPQSGHLPSPVSWLSLYSSLANSPAV